MTQYLSSSISPAMRHSCASTSQFPKASDVADRLVLPTCFEPYEAPAGFGIITCYFNPNRYQSRLRNYFLFRESLRLSGIPCLTIECLFDGQNSEFPGSTDVHTVIARDVMWQKERLLNLAIERTPHDWQVIAWVDGDVLFENRQWAVDAVAQLDRYAIVQLFSEIIRLPQGVTWGRQGQQWEGFAVVVKRTPNQLLNRSFARHGHTGFGWAARRDFLLRHGLYDGCISGTGDHLMAHAFAGDWTGECIDLTFGTAEDYRNHFTDWAQSAYRSIRARVAYVHGTVFHLWHGDIVNRCYDRCNRELALSRFNPATDLRVGADGCWEWATDKPSLHAWASDYFASRKEDGS